MGRFAGAVRASRRVAATLAVLLAVALVLVGVVPPARARAKAVPALAEAIGIDVPRPLAAEVEVTEARLGTAVGDLYAPVRRGRAPGVVLLPGATPAGRRDRRAVAAAQAVARAGRTVFVPDLALYRQDLDPADIEVVRAASAALAERTGRPVVLLGFSYGGGLALLAAAGQPRDGPIVQVAVFGAYFDLTGVIQAVTTGTSVVGDRRIPWQGDPAAGAQFAEVLVRLAPPGQAASLTAALAGQADPDGLAPEARALYDLAVNDDPDRVAALVARLHDDARAVVDGFSPSAVSDRVVVDVVALHSTDDPAVPWAEALRLQAALPRARVVLVDLFRHVDLIGERDLADWLRATPDLWRTARFGGWVLGAQEPWWPR
jgi:pimeloyl-ACP methyl ester carboxylesterase